MKKSPKIIVITGAESTGKSTLSESLGEYFNAPVIPEFARIYIEHLGRQYNYDDVEIIAKKQIEQLNTLKEEDHSVIFVDTWLIITKIWFEVVFKRFPEWLDESIVSSPIDLFLVCDTDLPWVADTVRENGGEMRSILQNMYIRNIKKYNFTYNIVNGKNHQRFNNALRHVKFLLEN